MNFLKSVVRLLGVSVALFVIPTLTTPINARTPATTSKAEKSTTASTQASLNLADFGAVGDGVTNDGPAFQAALDQLLTSGGGTLFVPAGRYLISTPVAKDFSALNDGAIKIHGVPSTTMPAPPSAPGNELSQGLNLPSEIIIATGLDHAAFTLANLNELSFEHLTFIGRATEFDDAIITLYLTGIDNAKIHHCEFYGLSAITPSSVYGAGNIVRTVQSELTIELSVFLGCTANSGAYGAVVESLHWKKISISNSIFLDYGTRPGFFSKTGLAAPLSWIDIGNASATSPEDPRREVVIRDTFLDEGGWVGISAFPQRWGPTSRIDLLYISGLKMNVSNLGTNGHYLFDMANIMVENSHYGWSHNAYAALDLYRSENVILDRLTCIDHADRIRVDSQTGRLTVVNSIYGGLDSAAQVTNVVNTAPAEDPVQYVRQRFVSALGRQPDPAAHFYWSDALLRCGTNSECITEKKSNLNQYLGQAPQANFAINGTVVDQNGVPVSSAAVNLTGSQTFATVTTSEGKFRFAKLPTSGAYTVTVTKQGHNIASQNLIHPATDATVVFQAQQIYSITGRILRANGTPLSGVTVQLAQPSTSSVLTDANGNYSFAQLPAGQSYTVTPSLQDFQFTPASLTFQNLSSNQTANFTGAKSIVEITGKVVNELGGPLGGVTVVLSGSRSAEATTNLQGTFTFSALPVNGSYTITVSKKHYTFAPSSRSVVNPTDNLSVEFQGRLNLHSITGRITRVDGKGISGVNVGLTQSTTVSAVTDANGNYSFENLPAGASYKVIPSSSEFVFTPVEVVLGELSSNQVVNFTGKLIPKLMTLEASNYLVALDSVTFVSQPFSTSRTFGSGGDGITRLAIFAQNIEPGVTASQMTVVTEDSAGNLYPLNLEFVGDVPGLSWLKQLNIKLSNTLPTGECLKLRLTVAGVASNDSQICIASAPSANMTITPY